MLQTYDGEPVVLISYKDLYELVKQKSTIKDEAFIRLLVDDYIVSEEETDFGNAV